MNYISYQNTTSNECLACMYANECKNIKACYKTLKCLKVDDIITYKSKLYKVKGLLLNQKANDIPLFLAV